ncbi:MAG: hypothetical protein LBC03_06255 [Nitrososphaerota archaeon]|nr:hypothetical protein [Nitrososphaerota archaeon]
MKNKIKPTTSEIVFRNDSLNMRSQNLSDFEEVFRRKQGSPILRTK